MLRFSDSRLHSYHSSSQFDLLYYNLQETIKLISIIYQIIRSIRSIRGHQIIRTEQTEFLLV
jgi:hypothetical protein